MRSILGVCLAAVLLPHGLFAAPINIVSYASLTGTEIVTFDDAAGGPAPGTNYDGIVTSGGEHFAERFVGQTVTTSGNFDVLSGSPSGALALQVGDSGRNLNVFDYPASPNHVLTGLGPLGFPDFEAIGEGAFTILFTNDQSQFGFQLVGGDGGNATLDFFRRNGSLIDRIVLGGLADDFYGFSREGGLLDIGGISIFNDDLGGIGFDNLKHDVAATPTAVPEPTSLLLLGTGAAGLVAKARRRKQQVQ